MQFSELQDGWLFVLELVAHPADRRMSLCHRVVCPTLSTFHKNRFCSFSSSRIFILFSRKLGMPGVHMASTRICVIAINNEDLE